ncbi:hypothetical protein [Legionella gresilensis]|uniref:hypothetical protein n=1 Tax=Legionella gresilensis TaxID=91823 RepID=UPI001040EF32|nr:hypothetical protein [Legionella gresilensis]
MPNFTEQGLLSLCVYSEFLDSDFLDLAYQNVCDDDLIDIINFLTMYPQIKFVDLHQNRIGAVGARYFAEHNKTVTVFDLSENRIGDIGAKYFAEHNKTVTALYLSQNEIGDVGAKDFAKYNTMVTEVELCWNKIGALGAKDFAEHNKMVLKILPSIVPSQRQFI